MVCERPPTERESRPLAPLTVERSGGVPLPPLADLSARVPLAYHPRHKGVVN